MLVQVMAPVVMLCVFVLSAGAGAEAHFADYFHLPAPTGQIQKELADAQPRQFALPEAEVRAYLRQPMPVYSLQDAQGTLISNKQMADNLPSHQVAVDEEIYLDAADLFGAPEVLEDGRHLFLAAIHSEGAHALRLRVDLMGLNAEESLYILDSEGRAAFGPYTDAHANTDGFWLPTMLGDAVVLALYSRDGLCPLLRIEAVSHFYKSIFRPGFPAPLFCNIPIDEETNPDALDVAAGVGILVIPIGGGQGYCSGALLNSIYTEGGSPAPYLISAWHCFDTTVNFAGVEVFWDYRSEDDDPYALESNAGAELVGHNRTLDAALLKLSGPVEAGPYGRTWLGWDADAPAVGNLVQCIHHPRAHSMKTSRGYVRDSAVRVCFNVSCTNAYEEQVEVLWTEGVTEPGSSGSPLLNRDRNFRLTGMLSNGPSHSCRDGANNYDNFGSFANFFPQIKCYLVEATECEKPYVPDDSKCFISRIFRPRAESQHNLRSFRDGVLAKTPLGRQLVEDYYEAGPVLEEWLAQDSVARVAFRGLLLLGEAVGAALP